MRIGCWVEPGRWGTHLALSPTIGKRCRGVVETDWQWYSLFSLMRARKVSELLSINRENVTSR